MSHNNCFLFLNCSSIHQSRQQMQFFSFISKVFFFFIRYFTFQMLSRKFPIPSSQPAPRSTHSHFLALAFPCTGAYKVCNTKGPLFPVMVN
ncbi:mCG146988 [Mus musculus]|nr:mCG146988 [Mus musculus]